MTTPPTHITPQGLEPLHVGHVHACQACVDPVGLHRRMLWVCGWLKDVSPRDPETRSWGAKWLPYRNVAARSAVLELILRSLHFTVSWKQCNNRQYEIPVSGSLRRLAVDCTGRGCTCLAASSCSILLDRHLLTVSAFINLCTGSVILQSILSGQMYDECRNDEESNDNHGCCYHRRTNNQSCFNNHQGINYQQYVLYRGLLLFSANSSSLYHCSSVLLYRNSHCKCAPMLILDH